MRGRRGGGPEGEPGATGVLKGAGGGPDLMPGGDTTSPVILSPGPGERGETLQRSEPLIRVLHVSASMEAIAGGPPVVVSRLAAAQAALGCAVTLLSYQPRSEQASVVPGLRACPGGDRVTLDLLAPPDRREYIFGARARAALRRIVPLHDIVHVAGIWEPLVSIAAGEARRAGVPYAIAPHGMLDPWALSQKKWKKRLVWWLRVRRLMNEAAFIHVLNRAERKRMAPLDLAPPHEVIPNGIFLEEFADMPGPDEFHAAHPELGGDPYIFFLGRLHHVKGLDVLADAFAIVASTNPRVRLVLAGPDGGFQAEFERLIRAHNLGHRVHLLGPVWGREKLSALAGAAVYCQPSRQEGFSVSITEALAAGIPAVVTEECRYPEVAEVGAGVVVALNPQAVAEGILSVLENPERDAMGMAGQSLVHNAYTWPLVARRSVEVYLLHLSGR